MATKNFPYNGGTGNNATNNDWIDMMSGVVNDGVINGFAVSAASGMQVAVALGKAFIQGIVYEETTGPNNLTIATADVTNARIDLVVAHEDITGQGSGSQLKVITGTPAPSPVAPTPTQTAYTTWEIPLATVLVPANASSSASFTITDKRTYVGNELQPSGVPATGKGGGTLYAPSNGAQVSVCVPFSKVMRAVPTISLNPQYQNNTSGSATATNIDQYGFNLQWTALNAGLTSWQGTYTTANN